MSSHDITIAGYLLFLALGIGLNAWAHRSGRALRQPPSGRTQRRGPQVPTVGQGFGRIMHTRTGRIAVVAWWAFIGFHLFSQ